MLSMEEKEVLVKVEGLSKKFCKDLKRSLKYGVQDLFPSLSRKEKSSVLRKDEFWAVRDISFELQRGECLGLIGHNGAGKSTLLKMLNGLINPDEGKITIRGRVGALIELGAGFNPLLTGRENIFNNGAVLGFSRKEIEEKVEGIIDFSEIREFIDMPVQNYSSGMKVRLGFAIASQMEPDVLIIDEVLAVGDVGFRMKCLTRIGSLLSKTAVIFVSHSMPQVSRISNKVLLMENGKPVVCNYDVSKAIDIYYNHFSNTEKVIGGNGKVKIQRFRVKDVDGRTIDPIGEVVSLSYNKAYTFCLDVYVEEGVKNYFVNYSFIDKDTKQVANLFSLISEKIFQKMEK